MPILPQTLEAYLAECRDSGCTERQIQVMELHLQGWSQERIAVHLGIAQQVVGRHLDRARRHINAGEHAEGRLLEHLLHQEIEEVIVFAEGIEDCEDTRSCWRRAALGHPSSNLGVMRPTRRRRRRPTGSADTREGALPVDKQAG